MVFCRSRTENLPTHTLRSPPVPIVLHASLLLKLDTAAVAASSVAAGEAVTGNAGAPDGAS